MRREATNDHACARTLARRTGHDADRVPGRDHHHVGRAGRDPQPLPRLGDPAAWSRRRRARARRPEERPRAHEPRAAPGDAGLHRVPGLQHPIFQRILDRVRALRPERLGRLHAEVGPVRLLRQPGSGGAAQSHEQGLPAIRGGDGGPARHQSEGIDPQRDGDADRHLLADRHELRGDLSSGPGQGPHQPARARGRDPGQELQRDARLGRRPWDTTP